MRQNSRSEPVKRTPPVGGPEAALASVPLGRAATPEEMADLVWFLAGEGRAAYVTGETITATGGSAFR